ncbi:MAG: Flp pilus assembly complex ATPase component TadA [Myxococcales bacterium]|nr:Flp pilus assembly complex ATPase component TadA [Myxococcales bacterium]
MEQRFLGEILARHGVLPAQRLEELLATQREKGGSLLELLVSTRTSDETAIGRALAAECGLPFVATIDPTKIASDVASKLPITWAKQRRIVVIGDDGKHIHAIAADPLDISAQDDVRALYGKPLALSVAPTTTILDAINSFFERLNTTEDLEKEKEDEADELTDIIDQSEDDAKIIRWVNSLFAEASKRRASDIHIEPEEREVMVRYRIDGELHEARRAGRAVMPNIVARVKIMAGLNIAEKRLPQDGRITLKIAGKGVDIRVSTIPTSRQQERIVMRLLNKSSVLLDLTDLGFYQREYAMMDHLIHRPHGIILVTGPTGAGKTTTLYACLNRINQPNINILTAEDPVEYELPRIHQVHVNAKIGLTFASALRAFLRQDPDVVMVGEIRDRETAEIAVHASLTGHLVLSTLHTNDAPSAVTRLAEMEIEPFMIASSMIGVLAQRLVRMLCPKCKEPYDAQDWELEQLGMDAAGIDQRLRRKFTAGYMPRGAQYDPPVPLDGKRPVFYRPRGCEECGASGYTGRRGIYELMLIDEGVRALVLKHGDAGAIRRAAIESGMDTMRDDGARKVLAGRTTVEEVLSSTQEDME